MQQRLVLLHLSLITGIGPASIERILKTISFQDLDNLYAMRLSDFVRLGLSPHQSSLIVEGLKDVSILNAEIELIERYAINWRTIVDDDYPALLKEIYLPPTVLYYKGILADDNKSLAIVGSRKASGYAQRVITTIIDALYGYPISIISGGAVGADSMAHGAAVQNNLITIAVIGSGILNPYPACNRRLFDRIVDQGGALISSFPLKTQALPGNFPARNRIIAGLSKGCLVIQAAKESGALITARFALEQGRDVFAIPGCIDDPLSVGCHNLIKEGAMLVQSADDILEHFGYRSDKEQKNKNRKDNQAVVENDLQKNIIVQCKNQATVDDLIESLQIDLKVLQQNLVKLQLLGLIEQNAAGFWVQI